MAKVQLITANDISVTLPEQQFNQRVVADGGTVRSKAFMQRVFEANKDLLADTELLFVPECGAKITDGKIEKLYNLVGTNDAVQATAGSRFYAGNLIAPSEKASIKNQDGVLGCYLDLTTPISFASDSEWSIVINLMLNRFGPFGQTTLKLFGAYITIYASGAVIETDAGGVVEGTGATFELGKNNTIIFKYKNGTGSILINKIPTTTTVTPRAITISKIATLSSHTMDGKINGFGVFDCAISASESQQIADFLATEFPAIETIAVGSQQVATSNLEATVFGGVAIPEVTDNSAWAALSTPAWCHYDNSPANGAIYGKLYNGFAVPVINANAPQGFHVPSELEWTMLSEYLGGNTVSGAKMKALYGVFNDGTASNEAGVSILAKGRRGANGSFELSDTHGFVWAAGESAGLGKYGYSTTASYSFAQYNEANKIFGLPIRLFSNTPHLEKLTYDSGWFATDIASSPKSIRIPFGCKVTNIKCITTTSVTAIEAKLFNYAGTELETLITGKACNATTKSFSVTADQSLSYTDNYVRVTAANNGGTQGMIIYVTIEPC